MPQKPVAEKVEETIKMITIPESLTIKELAEKMKLQPSAIVKKLFLQGQIVTLTLRSILKRQKRLPWSMRFSVRRKKR